MRVTLEGFHGAATGATAFALLFGQPIVAGVAFIFFGLATFLLTERRAGDRP